MIINEFYELLACLIQDRKELSYLPYLICNSLTNKLYDYLDSDEEVESSTLHDSTDTGIYIK